MFWNIRMVPLSSEPQEDGRKKWKWAADVLSVWKYLRKKHWEKQPAGWPIQLPKVTASSKMAASTTENVSPINMTVATI